MLSLFFLLPQDVGVLSAASVSVVGHLDVSGSLELVDLMALPMLVYKFLQPSSSCADMVQFMSVLALNSMGCVSSKNLD